MAAARAFTVLKEEVLGGIYTPEKTKPKHCLKTSATSAERCSIGRLDWTKCERKND
ncbi:MAG: hypothetical protein ACI8Q6_002901 [Granulosicoccus sp.]|jgi:hypothetical protein